MLGEVITAGIAAPENVRSAVISRALSHTRNRSAVVAPAPSNRTVTSTRAPLSSSGTLVGVVAMAAVVRVAPTQNCMRRVACWRIERWYWVAPERRPNTC